jgi:hypothetical protein
MSEYNWGNNLKVQNDVKAKRVVPSVANALPTWVTTTSYIVGDIVEQSNKIYKCLVAHTSGTFATDLTANNWVELSNSADANWNTAGNTNTAASILGSTDNTAVNLQSGTGDLNIATDATVQNLNIATGAAAKNITIGNSTGTSGILAFSGTSGETHITSAQVGAGFFFAQNSLSNGSVGQFLSSSTGKINNASGLDVRVDGALTSPNVNTNGVSIQNTHTGTGLTNVGLRVLATGATNNYGVIVENGSVGIGVADPTELLDVNGNVKFSNALMPNNIAGTVGQVLTSQGTGLAPIWTTAGSPNVRYGTAAPSVLGTDKKGDEYLRTTSGDGTTNATENYLFDGALWKLIPNAGSKWDILGNAGTTQATNFIGTTDNIGLSLRTNNNIRQTITNAGNVGIGTVTPISKLDVFGTTVSGGANNAKTGLVNISGGIGTYSLGNVLLNTTAIQAPVSVARFGLEGTVSVKQSPALDIKIGTHTAGLNASTRADIVLTNGNSTVPEITAMTILSTGNIGIDNATPASRLDVVSADNLFSTEIIKATAANLTQGTALTYNGLYSSGSLANVNLSIGAKGTGVTAIGVTSAGAAQGNVGIKTTTAVNTLQIGAAAVANTGGIRLPITSAIAPQIISNKFLTVDPSGDVVLASRADNILTTQTAAYTLTANDANTIVSINSATPVNITLSGLTTGQSVKVYQQGAGQLTFVTGTLTRRHVFNLFSSAGQFSIVEITAIGTDAILSGQLA